MASNQVGPCAQVRPACAPLLACPCLTVSNMHGYTGKGNEQQALLPDRSQRGLCQQVQPVGDQNLW